MVNETVIIFNNNIDNLGSLDTHFFRKDRVWQFSTELTQIIVEAYRGGMTLREIGERFGVERCVIKRILTKSGEAIRDFSSAQKVLNARKTPEQRRQMVASANDAWREREWTEEDSIKNAINRFRCQSHVSPLEEEFYQILTTLGYTNILQQVPCFSYNIDFVIGDVAIEIFGGNWHNTPDQTLRDSTKLKKVLNCGYRSLIIWVRDYAPLTIEGVKDIFTTFQLSRSDESSIGQYWVFYGNGECVASLSFNGDGLPYVPFSHKEFNARTSDPCVR